MSEAGWPVEMALRMSLRYVLGLTLFILAVSTKETKRA